MKKSYKKSSLNNIISKRLLLKASNNKRYCPKNYRNNKTYLAKDYHLRNVKKTLFLENLVKNINKHVTRNRFFEILFNCYSFLNRNQQINKFKQTC